MRLSMILMCSMIGLAGCAAESRLAPRSTDMAGGGSSSVEPESSNSLPRGSSVNRPLTSPVGDIGTTQVGPSRNGTPLVAARGPLPVQQPAY